MVFIHWNLLYVHHCIHMYLYNSFFNNYIYYSYDILLIYKIIDKIIYFYSW